MFTHHRTWATRYHPGILGKKGMRQFKVKKSNVWNEQLQVGQLWNLLDHTALQTAQKNGQNKPVEFNLSQLGIHRLLGNGSLPP
mmetsp:Transcript_6483/g.13846  ORF Transcript_6483/g.13846 Transcript_6483/m.13846 type:complete len:84 (-) Transcript_6483:169-420(-)